MKTPIHMRKLITLMAAGLAAFCVLLSFGACGETEVTVEPSEEDMVMKEEDFYDLDETHHPTDAQMEALLDDIA